MMAAAKRPPARALKPPPGGAMPSHSDLQLPDLVEFRRGEGQISFHDERVLMVSAAAIGALRREIIASLGIDAARRLLFRFGFTNGYRDAISLRAGFPWEDPLDGIRMGAMLHGIEGAVHADLVRLSRHPVSNRFEAESLWRNSYEADQHLRQCGPSAAPACWTLCGYASGFCSACLGREVYFRETQCAAQSGSHCVVVGKDAESWGDERERLRAEYGGDALLAELEQPNHPVHSGRDPAGRRERRGSGHSGELDVLLSVCIRLAAPPRLVDCSISSRQRSQSSSPTRFSRIWTRPSNCMACGESGAAWENEELADPRAKGS